jgi:hypothetical protein
MDILLSSSPVDNVDISESSTKEPSKITEVCRTLTALSNSVDQDDEYYDDDFSTENGMEQEWSWDQDSAPLPTSTEVQIIEECPKVLSNSPIKEKTVRPQIAENIEELDIKNKKLEKLEGPKEVDFFSDFDMAPTFQKPSQAIFQETDKPEVAESNRLQMSTAADSENDGWDEDEWNNEEIL